MKRRQKKKCHSLFHCHQTQAISLFEAVKDLYEDREILMKNIIQCDTDGAPAMVERHRGFIGPHETRDFWCYSDSLSYSQTPSRG